MTNNDRIDVAINDAYNKKAIRMPEALKDIKESMINISIQNCS
jgi:hypothetical protein